MVEQLFSRGTEPGFDIRARIIYKGNTHGASRTGVPERHIKIIIHEGLLNTQTYTLHLEPSRECELEFLRMLKDLQKHGLTFF